MTNLDFYGDFIEPTTQKPGNKNNVCAGIRVPEG